MSIFKKEDISPSKNQPNGFHNKLLESPPDLSKTIYEDGLDVQSDDWKGSSITRVITDSCVHFESEIVLPLNNDKGTFRKIRQC